MLPETERRILQLQSQVLKVLSNPKRLEILHDLRRGEMTVTEIVLATGMRQATVSQHLAMMRRSGVVSERRVANAVYYTITDRRINHACDIMLSFLVERSKADSELVKMVRPIAGRR
jgi:ArsR family transcriptional regulator